MTSTRFSSDKAPNIKHHVDSCTCAVKDSVSSSGWKTMFLRDFQDLCLLQSHTDTLSVLCTICISVETHQSAFSEDFSAKLDIFMMLSVQRSSSIYPVVLFILILCTQAYVQRYQQTITRCSKVLSILGNSEKSAQDQLFERKRATETGFYHPVFDEAHLESAGMFGKFMRTT